jgi:hypothetical protein
MGCCAGGLLAALLGVRPLTLGTLTGGAATALAFPVGFAAARWRRRRQGLAALWVRLVQPAASMVASIARMSS